MWLKGMGERMFKIISSKWTGSFGDYIDNHSWMRKLWMGIERKF
jgi:hypothetical protein